MIQRRVFSFFYVTFSEFFFYWAMPPRWERTEALRSIELILIAYPLWRLPQGAGPRFEPGSYRVIGKRVCHTAMPHPRLNIWITLCRGRDPVRERRVAAGHVPRGGHRHFQEHPGWAGQYQPRQAGRASQAVITGLIFEIYLIVLKLHIFNLNFTKINITYTPALSRFTYLHF